MMGVNRYLSRKFLVFFFTAFLIQGCSPKLSLRENKVCFKDQCVRVEVVQKKDELSRGLQFRRSMGADEGMLFVFSNSQAYSFWMKDTWIPLDIIWLDYSKRVVHIAKNVPPCKSDPCPIYTPSSEALYVVEVNGKYADRLGVRIGDFAEFSLKE